jgi:hypothetical protein
MRQKPPPPLPRRGTRRKRICSITSRAPLHSLPYCVTTDFTVVRSSALARRPHPWTMIAAGGGHRSSRDWHGVDDSSRLCTGRSDCSAASLLRPGCSCRSLSSTSIHPLPVRRCRRIPPAHTPTSASRSNWLLSAGRKLYVPDHRAPSSGPIFRPGIGGRPRRRCCRTVVPLCR